MRFVSMPGADSSTACHRLISPAACDAALVVAPLRPDVAAYRVAAALEAWALPALPHF